MNAKTNTSKRSVQSAADVAAEPDAAHAATPKETDATEMTEIAIAETDTTTIATTKTAATTQTATTETRAPGYDVAAKETEAS